MFNRNYRYAKGEKDWLSVVGSLGSILSDERPIEVHHCAGRTAKHCKVLIGPWWVIPLTPQEHKDIVKTRERKHLEKELFAAMCLDLIEQGYEIPFGDDVTKAIAEYHK